LNWLDEGDSGKVIWSNQSKSKLGTSFPSLQSYPETPESGEQLRKAMHSSFSFRHTKLLDPRHYG